MGPLSVEQVLAQEVDAINGPKSREPNAALHKLVTHQDVATARAAKDADAHSDKKEEKTDVDKRKSFYRELNKLNRAALCCSGGGIRSATFCLGVIQALAMFIGKNGSPIPRPISELEHDDAVNYADQSLLSRFHYLSTVSGGGYIGSWLSAWRSRDDFTTVWENLAGRPEGPDVEPAEISWLRAYSNYLTPQIGLGSADTWTGVAIFLRNLILNWLVIVPAIAVVLLGLKLAITFAVALARFSDMPVIHLATLMVGVACLVVAQAFTTKHRPTRRLAAHADKHNDPNNIKQKEFLLGDLLWSLASAFFVTSALTSAVGVQTAFGAETHTAIFVGAGLGLLIFAAGWLAGNPVHWRGRDLCRWALSGLVYGGLVGYGIHTYAGLMPYYDGAANKVFMILLPVILGVPWILVSQLFAEMVFVGLVSYQLNSDADREWLGRAAGWSAATAVIWILVTFVTFAGAYLLIGLGKLVATYIAAAGGISGAVTAWLGKSAKTPAKKSGEKSTPMAIAYSVGIAIAGPLFAAILVVGISIGLDLLLLGDSLIGGLAGFEWNGLYIFGWLIVGLAAAFGVAAVASKCVNINRFSLHALYRNRLVRAYLGASRQKRCPDEFTGFDDEDNIPAHKLWPPKESEREPGKNTLRLFHVINITLNVVKTARLAWQERKAESFTVSPLHCGAAYKGYRPSIEYGGGAPYGLSLGTAMAISGAAASPNMGYHSSPSITLLLALFNVRLGWWLGNPGEEGEKTYKDEGPKTAIEPLVAETFGLTTDDAPYVYLSDGGHFENLGLYEMVRRRCRHIVVIDAGCDPNFAFEDLGNAVRKIFIDLGIRITFVGLEKLANRPAEPVSSGRKDNGKNLITANPDATQSSSQDEIPYHAVGYIHYNEADGTGNKDAKDGDDGPRCEDGRIIYIKPAVHFGTSESAGVRSYAKANKTFPHETTGDQFFSESQFESYRSLGFDIMNNILRGAGKFDHGTVEDFLKGM